jgi:transposase-like protein
LALVNDTSITMTGMPVRRARREAAEKAARDAQNLPEPTGYTPEQKQIIVDDAVESLASGASIKGIAHRHGIAAKTLTAWLIVDD